MKHLNIIIVEDEMGAANSLKLLLEEISPGAKVLATLTSVAQTLEWLAANDFPDLAFFDIQLEDGSSFEIFKKMEIDFPVVFTTAFDQYAIDAFKVNSIDYLLKPIKDTDLLFSLKKYEHLNKATMDSKLAESILDVVSQSQTTTFLVHYKDKLIPVAAAEIAFFYIDNGLVHGCTHGRQVYPIENTLDELEKTLRRQQFFRANRQFIINKTAVKELEFYLNGRLLVNTLPPSPESILISKARVPVFKEWLKG